MHPTCLDLDLGLLASRLVRQYISVAQATHYTDGSTLLWQPWAAHALACHPFLSYSHSPSGSTAVVNHSRVNPPPRACFLGTLDRCQTDVSCPSPAQVSPELQTTAPAATEHLHLDSPQVL